MQVISQVHRTRKKTPAGTRPRGRGSRASGSCAGAPVRAFCGFGGRTPRSRPGSLRPGRRAPRSSPSSHSSASASCSRRGRACTAREGYDRKENEQREQDARDAEASSVAWGNGCMLRQLRRAAAEIVVPTVRSHRGRIGGKAGDRHRGVERDRRGRPQRRLPRRARRLSPGRAATAPWTSPTRRVAGAFVDGALARLGGLEILVNNAGLSRERDPVWESKEADEHQVIATNVLGLMRMTRLCVPHLVDSWRRPHRQPGVGAGIWFVRERPRHTSRRSSRCTGTRVLCATTCRGSRSGSRTSPRASSRRTSRASGSRRRGEGARCLLERRDGRTVARRGRRRLDPVRTHASGERQHRRDRADRASRRPPAATSCASRSSGG